MSNFPSVGHVAVTVSDLERSIPWYQALFGTAPVLDEDTGPFRHVVWAVGELYNQAGLPELGHQFSRGKLTDFLAHYPEGKWRVAWQVAYPRAFEGIIVNACAQNMIPTPLAWGIMREESSFVTDVRSHSNAIGLMQLIPPTAKWMACSAATLTAGGSHQASKRRMANCYSRPWAALRWSIRRPCPSTRCRRRCRSKT